MRFNDPHQNRSWSTNDVFPSQHWTFSNRTFDLTAARSDRICKTGKKVPGSQSQQVDLPIYGAILLSDGPEDRIFIQFRELSRIWNNDRILFKISRYHAYRIFTSFDWDFINQSDEQPQSMKLCDGSLFRVELRTQNVTDQKIALLAVTVEGRAPGTMSSLKSQVSAIVHTHKKHK